MDDFLKILAKRLVESGEKGQELGYFKDEGHNNLNWEFQTLYEEDLYKLILDIYKKESWRVFG